MDIRKLDGEDYPEGVYDYVLDDKFLFERYKNGSEWIDVGEYYVKDGTICGEGTRTYPNFVELTKKDEYSKDSFKEFFDHCPTALEIEKQHSHSFVYAHGFVLCLIELEPFMEKATGE